MEARLILGMQKGDDACFKKIYELYAYKVYNFILKYTNQAADTEDVLQNVFIHLWKYRKTFNEHTVLEAILFKTAKQEVSKWYKNKKNTILDTPISEFKMIESETSSNYLETHKREFVLIKTLLEKVPARRRKIFQLHKIEGKSYKEIALEMDMSTSAVANQISKTLQFLRKELDTNSSTWAIIIWLYLFCK